MIDEIRMMYDAYKSGLNDLVFVSWVSMPAIGSHLRSMKARTFIVDCDVDDFLNSCLSLKFDLTLGLT